jgi:hypothetical protein
MSVDNIEFFAATLQVIRDEIHALLEQQILDGTCTDSPDELDEDEEYVKQTTPAEDDSFEWDEDEYIGCTDDETFSEDDSEAY